MIFLETFPDCFLQHSDPKSAIKNIGLGDIIGWSYPLNPCMLIPSVHPTFCRNGKHTFRVILEITKLVYTFDQQEQLNFCSMAQAHVLKRY